MPADIRGHGALATPGSPRRHQTSHVVEIRREAVTFAPRESVRTGLDHLEERLGPLIESHLAGRLNGKPWTSVLEELDVARRRPVRRYNAGDVQSQLRMLTERLGDLGHPFDKGGDRLVSTLGNYLRILRNAEKHNDPLTAMDAVRTHDCCSRLLQHFEDQTGARVATDHLHAALAGVLAEFRVAADPGAAGLDAGLVGQETADVSEDSHDADLGALLVEPDAVVLDRQSVGATPIIGSSRLTFDPWVPTVVGDESVIDNVARQANKARVRAVAQEAVEHEGPIHRDRLAEHIGSAFGIRRLTARRSQQITRQLKQIGLVMDSEKFYWPPDIDPQTWTEFRPNNSTVARNFMHVSPVEVANAMRLIQTTLPDLSAEEIDAATLRTFGRQKRSKNAAAHLAVARQFLGAPATAMN
ncbi:DUF3320 domain-containing protein [Promicromonospora soli]